MYVISYTVLLLHRWLTHLVKIPHGVEIPCVMHFVSSSSSSISRSKSFRSFFGIILCFPYSTIDLAYSAMCLWLSLAAIRALKMSFAITFLYFWKYSKLRYLLLYFRSIHSFFITCSFCQPILLQYLLNTIKKNSFHIHCAILFE